MELKCFVLRVARTSGGMITILDFPENEKPHIGTLVMDEKKMVFWKIAGIGLPIFLNLIEEKIATYYKNNIVWDCLLIPVEHSEDLTAGSILQIKNNNVTSLK